MNESSKYKISLRFLVTFFSVIVSTIAYAATLIFSEIGLAPFDHAPSALVITETRIYDAITILIVLFMWFSFLRGHYKRALWSGLPIFILLSFLLLLL